MPARNAVTFSGNATRPRRTDRSVQSAASRPSQNAAGRVCRWSRTRHGQRRQPCGVQDLVGIGIPDAGERGAGSVSARLSVWFSRRERGGEGPLDRARAARSRRDHEPRARSRPRTRCSDARRLAPASVSTSVPSAKSSPSSAPRPASVASGCAPVQPARDHQVDDQPQLAFEADRDALADPAQLGDRAPLGSRRAAARPCAG